jgi:hypothetical protein
VLQYSRSGPSVCGCPRGWLREVRAPQGRALGNTQAGRPDGKWHRNTPPFVAKVMEGKGEVVR